ncbi:MAG: mandelate racemase/muconate lactonizing enzyme family protein [Alphaproteobacteria bacterium]|nr:mandelate racemase/muconate lactonizing enzyme family protein [Alphaproteobacteria bacterium]
MRIRRVDVHVLKSPLAQPFAFSQGWVRQRSATLVEITTDDGLTGWGEAFAQGLEPPEIAAKAIEVALTPLLLGEDPRAVEVLWHRMYHATRDYGRKGTIVSAISAVDIALWDIAGKAAGLPVHMLLGGAFRGSVEAYATGFYRISGQGESARLADEALQHHAAGFRHMKVKLGYGVADDIAVMEAIGDAIAGKPVRLMIDTNHAYGVADAVRLGRALERFDLRWYEEPVAPEDLDGYREIRARLSMPIAGGENEHTLYGFRDLLAARAVDVAQPDIGSAGGFTACRHIAALAQAHGVAVNPHVWGSAVAQAASLQLIAALPVANHSLFAAEPILEYDRSSHPFRRALITEPIEHVDGRVAIPTRPGLGIEIDRDVLARYRS